MSESHRLAALDRYGILDSPPEPNFDRISRLAAQFFQTPMAAISFVTQDQSWFKSRCGFDETQLARTASFCSHTIGSPGALVVPDARMDATFADLAIVTGEPRIRFYAGLPLKTPDGFAIGTIAVMDTAPRSDLSEQQLAALADFGSLVHEELNRRVLARTPFPDLRQRLADLLPAIVRAEERLRLAEETITEFKRAEESARAQNELLQTILDRIPIFVAMLDPLGKFQFVNREYQRVFGWALEEQNAAGLLARVASDPAVHRAMLDHLASTETGWRDFPQRLRDGAIIHTSWMVAHLSDGSSLGFGLDITPRIEAEAQLRASEERFRLLIEHGLEIVGIIDASAVTRYVSPSVQRVMGYPPSVLTGASAFDYIHPDDHPTIQQAMEHVLRASNATTTIEFRFKHADGSWRYAESAATNAMDIAGVNGIIVNFRDITLRKRFEHQLRDSQDQLRRLASHVESAQEEERIRIAREIHDELGQLLSALKLDIEGFRKYLPENPELARAFKRRIARARRQTELTINTVRRISAELRPGILDHLGLCAALRWQIDEFASRTGIRCDCRGLAEDLRLPPGQATAVFRIFQEALTNILRHAEATAITVDLRRKSGRLTLIVADDGKGMAPAHLDDPRSLGLLGMRERALLLGGEVRFSRRRGGGTVVTLRMPSQA